MRRLSLYFFLAAMCASNAYAADGAMSARILAATGGVDTDAERTSPRGGNTTTTDTTKTDNRATRARTTKNSTTPDTPAQKVDNSTVVRSGARVVNISNPAPKVSRTDTNTSVPVAARATRNRETQPKQLSAREKLDAATSNVGQSVRTSQSSINSKPAIRRAGLVLRPSVADVGGRAKIAGTDLYTGSNIDDEIRTVTSRAATTTVTSEGIAEAKDRLEKTAELNKSCQDQYNECMDQFCAVIDANQKRCSCSSNLSQYAKVEAAVKDANNQLNEVAQRIRYIGLSADEIRAILNETEAEEVLSSNQDNTETRNMLEDIEKLIENPNASVNYSSSTNSFSGLDLDLDFSSDANDMFSLDFLNGSSDSFSSLRGAQLYSAAKKRCNTVLNHCKEAGATVNQITGNYDLAIDKDCIAYEQGLTKMNDTLKNNIRSATTMLQKARLSVLQNKNQYDAKGCIGALEKCMTDEMVCGEDYAKCLDPTKIYIDENGEVVMGQNISHITEFMEEFNNAAITPSFLSSAYGQPINPTACKADTDENNDNKKFGNNGSCVVSYLLRKIGTKQKVTEEGLCRAVLDKCQAYTYTGDTYNPYNDVVVNYVQRAMVNIKAAQARIISDYASSCMADISACYNQQVSQINSWSSSASVASIRSVMRGACRNVALTCAYAVFSGPKCTITPDTSNQDKYTVTCTDNTNDSALCSDPETCINSISEVFYQSLLCPDNSTYNKNGKPASGGQKFVNAWCECNDDYAPFKGSCVIECEKGYEFDAYGECEKTTNNTSTVSEEGTE